MIDLTQTFTMLDCDKYDDLLRTIESDNTDTEKLLEQLRRPPRLRPLPDIRNRYDERGYPESLFNLMYDAVKKRAEGNGSPYERWRKGFAYSLVFSGKKDDNHTILRILPGLYIGPGGVVEAQGVMLKRPEDRNISLKKMKEKSIRLWELAECINNRTKRK